MPHVNVYDTDNDLFFKHKTAYPPRLNGHENESQFPKHITGCTFFRRDSCEENEGESWP